VSNLTLNPMLGADRRLTPGSSGIDTGTDPAAVHAILAAWAGYDLDGLERPLDGDGDGQSRWDIGASEFLLASADSNSDGIPDGWCQQHGLGLLDSSVANGDPDRDGRTTLEEWISDTNPTNGSSFFHIDSIAVSEPDVVVQLITSSNRVYGLFCTTNLDAGASWQPVGGQDNIAGTGGLSVLRDTNNVPAKYYRVRVSRP
jgi:hypothetical protein